MQALSKKTLTASATILLTLFVILFASLNNYFANRIALNTKIGNASLANKKISDAHESIASEFTVFTNSPVTFYVGDTPVQSDLQSLGIEMNKEETLEIIKRLGKSPNARKNMIFWLESPFVTRQISPQYSLDISKFAETTGAIFSKFGEKPQEAAIIFKNGTFEIQEGQPGTLINQAKLISDLKKNIADLSHFAINLEITASEPAFKAAQA